MKKNLIILVALMMLALNINASAETIANGTESIDVNAQMVDNSTTPNVYSLEITWDEMNFSYVKEGEVKWNPATHKYEDKTQGTWSDYESKITVTNHSNKDVTVAFSFAPETNFNNLTGVFDIASKNLSAGVENHPESADSFESKFKLQGVYTSESSNSIKVGTITIRVS